MGWSAFRATGLTHHTPTRSTKGYTLFTPLGGQDTLLIDMQGKVVHRWHFAEVRPGYAQLLPNGRLLIQVNDLQKPPPLPPEEWLDVSAEQRVRYLGGNASRLQEYDWHGELVWEYQDPFIHHDVCRLENGNTVMPRWHVMSPEASFEVRGGNVKRQRGNEMLGDEFIEIDASGKVVWQVDLSALLDPVKDPIERNNARIEWTHVNSVKVSRQKLLFSSRNTHRVGCIDRAAGELEWKIGDPLIHDQHHATWLPNGNVQIFDNGMNRPGFPHSRVIEVDPSNGEVVWSYQADPPLEFFSPHISGAERFDNDHVLICEGYSGRLFEITPSGEIVWEWVSPFRHRVLSGANATWIFRAHRYGADYPGLGEIEPQRHAAFNSLYGLG